MIELIDLAKSFGAIKAVDGLSFYLPTGKTLGLLGPNGAGKSTTINMICGLVKPDRGVIRIDHVDDPTRRDVRQRLGVAPQQLSLYGDLTGEENLRFFGTLYGLSGRVLRDRVDFALDFVGLSSRGSDRVVTYSGGMARRLNLAVALVHDPPVYLLDEPTVGVDPQSRNALFENVEHLRQQGRTIIYTTHYMEEAERLCDLVAVVDHGKVLAMDTVPGLLRSYGGLSRVSVEFAGGAVETNGLTTQGRWNGSRYVCETDHPAAIVGEWAHAGLEVASMEVKGPDLESVFLHLTGRSLRD